VLQHYVMMLPIFARMVYTVLQSLTVAHTLLTLDLGEF